MLTWISQNAVTILTFAILAAVVALAVRALIREKKGKSGGCTGNCASCGKGGCGK